MTKQSGYATKQTGYFWTKQLGLNTKAQATRNGQPTPKLDKKIEKMKAMMGSTVQKVPAAKPSASKFVDYKGVNKLPMQGGACTPK